MVRVILVRHGQTDWNVQRRYQGWTETPLSALGRAQAEALASRLQSERLDAILSSDLPRAWQTATAIAIHHRVDVRSEPRLREAAFGAWEGLTYNEIRACDPDRLARWIEDPSTVSPPGGETLTAVGERAQGVLEVLARDDGQRTVLVVSHGGTLRILLCLALEMSPLNHWRFRLDEGSLTELYLYDTGAILARLNDRHHL